MSFIATLMTAILYALLWSSVTVGILGNVAPNPAAMENISEAGDYQRATLARTHWVVVDDDPSGLNCRMTPSYDLYDYDRPNDIYNWPVERTLAWGQRFYTLPSMAGDLFYDDRDLPWLFVRFNRDPDNPQGCFVRANRRYVEPLP